MVHGIRWKWKYHKSFLDCLTLSFNKYAYGEKGIYRHVSEYGGFRYKVRKIASSIVHSTSRKHACYKACTPSFSLEMANRCVKNVELKMTWVLGGTSPVYVNGRLQTSGSLALQTPLYAIVDGPSASLLRLTQ